jgi:alpha-1,2-mannosyltransferase
MHDPVTAAKPTGLTNLRLFVAIAVPVFVVFFATADRSIPYHIDPFTNVISASTIGNTASPILSDYSALAEPGRYAVFGWVVDSPRGPVSQYPPGAALLAAPLYGLLADQGTTVEIFAFNDPDAEPIDMLIPPLWPAALVASLASAAAVGFTALSVRTVTGSTRWAIAAGITLAAGTGLWLNGAFQLWQHGPAAMWIAAAIWVASRSSWFASGLVAGLAVITRPPVAIISAGIGVSSAVRQRSWSPAIKHGLGASLGTGLLLAYNYWLFDTLTISGGYGSGFTDNLVGSEWGWYAKNLAGAFFSIDRGLFVWSPIAAIALLGLPAVWKRAPGWAIGGFIGGGVLLLVQFRLNRYSGGDGFFSYRYPLEAVVAGTPLLAAGAKHLWESSRLRLLVPTAAVASVGFHLIALARELAG